MIDYHMYHEEYDRLSLMLIRKERYCKELIISIFMWVL